MSALSRARAIRRIRTRSWRWAAACGGFIQVPLQAGIIIRVAIAFSGAAVITLAASSWAQHGQSIVAPRSGGYSRRNAVDVRWLRGIGVATAAASKTRSVYCERCNRAVEMRLPGLSKGVKIIHPLDLLASRLHNLAQIPSKRDAQGVAQARLAISVVGAFIRHAHSTLQERDVFAFVEEVRRIALNKKLGRVYYEYGFDVLAAVPVELFKNEHFLSKRWPQIQALVAEQRESQAKLCSKYAPWPE